MFGICKNSIFYHDIVILFHSSKNVNMKRKLGASKFDFYKKSINEKGTSQYWYKRLFSLPVYER